MNNWSKEFPKGIAYKIILFIISPILASLYSLKRINTKSSYMVFFLTCTLFGLSFTVKSGKENDSSALDGQYYRNFFEDYQYISIHQFQEKFITYIHFDSNIKDFYIDIISFLVSRFTDNYHVMFALVAMIFSYFSLKSFKFFTKEPEFDATLITYILTYLFMYISIFNINAFRFWTAAWIGIYCIFQIYRNNNKKFILLALFTPFIHGSFFIFLLILLVSLVFRRFEKFWIILFSISFLFSSFAASILQSLTTNFEAYLPKIIPAYVDSYTDSIENLTQGTGFYWVNSLFLVLVKIYLYLLVIIFIKNNSAIKKDSRTKDIYLFLLVWLTCFNFLSSIPSLGNRFNSLALPFIAYIALLHVKKTKFQIFLLLLPLVYSFTIYEQVRLYIAVLEPSFYYSSPFYLTFKYLIGI